MTDEPVTIPRDLARDPRRKRLAIFTLLGPAFVAAVAYVDPGNVASNVQAGARYGYLLVWILVLATITAGVVQYLSAKLGVVTGRSLPQLVGDRLGAKSRVAYWMQAEAVAMATDVAEIIGGAIALELLFGLPLLLGGLISGVVSMGLLLVQDRGGQRRFERVITGMLLIIAIGFIAGLFVAPPSAAKTIAGLVPRFAGSDSVLLATAMFGATVMPHVVYLHSALSRDRFGATEEIGERRRLLRGTRLDVALAMILAGAVNIAMLLLAASSLMGRPGVATIEGAHSAVRNQLGSTIAVLFAVALLASGLASTSVGAYAGSVIMEGLIRRKVSILARRVVTLIPALVLLACGIDPTSALIISQVVLSFGLPFALVPLIRFTANRGVMGAEANGAVTTAVGWVLAAAVSALNVFLVVSLVAAH